VHLTTIHSAFVTLELSQYPMGQLPVFTGVSTIENYTMKYCIQLGLIDGHPNKYLIQ